jgi:small subunit ribosomal protein S21
VILVPGIKVKDSESFDEAYRRFKKQCDRNLIVTETRAKNFCKKENVKKTIHAKKIRIKIIISRFVETKKREAQLSFSFFLP